MIEHLFMLQMKEGGGSKLTCDLILNFLRVGISTGSGEQKQRYS